ncbi:MAG: hypothetical protein KBC72_00525 [Acinetobacter sp.]|nr:hypothetical protein [Acinetobacter sp.]
MDAADEARISDVVGSMDSTPESSTGTDAQVADSSTAKPTSDTEGNVPWHQDQRWQKWQSEEKSLRQKAELLAKNSQAIEWFRALSSDPQKFEAVKAVFTGQPQVAAKPKDDPYASWDPEVAGKFKQVDEVSDTVKELRQELYQTKVDRNIDVLDSHFEQFCGDKKLTSPAVKENLAALTFMSLQQMVGPETDIRLASMEQVEKALEHAYSRVDEVGKWYMGGSPDAAPAKKVVVPPSGSAHGVAPRQERLMDDAARIRELMSM